MATEKLLNLATLGAGGAIGGFSQLRKIKWGFLAHMRDIARAGKQAQFGEHRAASHRQERIDAF